MVLEKSCAFQDAPVNKCVVHRSSAGGWLEQRGLGWTSGAGAVLDKGCAAGMAGGIEWHIIVFCFCASGMSPGVYWSEELEVGVATQADDLMCSGTEMNRKIVQDVPMNKYEVRGTTGTEESDEPAPSEGTGRGTLGRRTPSVSASCWTSWGWPTATV